MVYLQGSIFCLLSCLSVIFSRMRPRTKPTKAVSFEMPDEIRQSDLGYLKVPSEEFCAQKDLSSGQLYLVLPWWYSYCLRLNEKKEKKYMENKFFLPVYSQVLKQLHNYRARKKDIHRKLSG